MMYTKEGERARAPFRLIQAEDQFTNNELIFGNALFPGNNFININNFICFRNNSEIYILAV